MKVLFLVVVFATIAYAKVGQKCGGNIECEEGECCQVLSEYMVVSRKRANPGTCQVYTPLNGNCGVFDKINGYCSCAPGLKCTGIEVPLKGSSGPAKKSIIAPRPGYTWNFLCKPAETSVLQPSF